MQNRNCIGSFFIFLKGELKMATVDFPSNSNRSKEAAAKTEKQLPKVVNGTAKTKKKSLGDRFADTFVSESAKDVKEYIIFDVLIPAVKDTFADIVNNGLNMLLYGETSRRSSSKKRSGERTSYSRYYDEPRRNRQSSKSEDRNERHGYNYDEVILDTRSDAEDLLTQMYEVIDKYDFVSVFDMYEMAGVKTEYTDKNWGWDDITSASIVREKDGYRLKLPRPKAY